MLAYVLALTVGLGCIALYMAAFFFPEIHRKSDFYLSGVGLFYALMLWVFAPRITGGLLLGHIASVVLLGWFTWQTLSLRRQVTPKAQQTPVPTTQEVQTTLQQQVSNLSLQERLGQIQNSLSGIFSGAKGRLQQTVSKKTPETPKTQETAPKPTEKPAVEVIDNRTPTPEQPKDTTSATADTEAKTESAPEAIPPHPPSPELVEEAKQSAAEAEAIAQETEKIPVEEIAPDAELAPPAEAPPEQTPPKPEQS